jgi:hypothetical protein
MKLQPEDVGIMSEWWEKRGLALNWKFLPELGFGIWENQDLMCGAFLCEMDLNGGKGGLISWTIVNPDHMASALRVVNLLLGEIIAYASTNKFVALMGTTTSRLLAKTYKDNGFQLGDQNTNQYLLQ